LRAEAVAGFQAAMIISCTPGTLLMTADPFLNQQQPRSVLVVGADELVAKTVSRVLPEWTLIRVEDNQAALSLLQTEHCEVVVTGEKSTGQEDVELLVKIRRVWPHTHLIIFTDESTPADVIAAIRGRAFSYFSKPYTQEAFAQMLRLATETPVWDEGIELVSATPAWIVLAARCDLATADRLIQFVHEMTDLPQEEQEKVGLAFREMLLNAVGHGGQFDPSKHVEISYVRARHMVMCRIKDPGKGFSWQESLHAATNNPPDDPSRHLKHREAVGMRPGGYGILIAENLVDELIYGEKGNDVLLVKYLDLAPAVNAEDASAG
jgi:anti-sigma regulatory factor (Ser/Thr protein kinase)/ActR/RegA family two-component response regulator